MVVFGGFWRDQRHCSQCVLSGSSDGGCVREDTSAASH